MRPVRRHKAGARPVLVLMMLQCIRAPRCHAGCRIRDHVPSRTTGSARGLFEAAVLQRIDPFSIFDPDTVRMDQLSNARAGGGRRHNVAAGGVTGMHTLPPLDEHLEPLSAEQYFKLLWELQLPSPSVEVLVALPYDVVVMQAAIILMYRTATGSEASAVYCMWLIDIWCNLRKLL